MKRSDSDVFTKAAIKVRLGEAEYEVKPLTISKARAWRETFHRSMEPILEVFRNDGTGGLASAMTGGLTVALLNFPDAIAKLVFAYAPNLPEAAILDPNTGATDEQMAKAFSQIMEVAYPYLAQLATVKTALQAAVSQQ